MSIRHKIIVAYLKANKKFSSEDIKKLAKKFNTTRRYVRVTLSNYNLNLRVGSIKPNTFENEIKDFTYDIENEIKHIDVDAIYNNFKRFHQ
jgi:hypothetical protein